MDKTIASMIAVIGALAPLGAAQAATPSSEVEQAMQARSFSELLQPIPNAASVLKAVNERVADESPTDSQPCVQVAQYHHHHHNHHHHWRRWYHHHHHHHHYY
jgi:hypothetical protein